MTFKRNFQFGFPYHITSRGNQRNSIFIESRDYLYCKKLLHKYSAWFEVPLISYCLMPNHYHLLVQYIQQDSISRMMHMVNTAYAMHIKKKYDWSGHVFQSRYHSVQVSDIAYFNTVLMYIKNNPIKAEYCKKYNDYPWLYIDNEIVNKIPQVYRLMQ